SDSYSVGLLLSLIDNYFVLYDKQFTFCLMTQKQYDEPFKGQINIKKNTEIFKFIQLLLVLDRVNRCSLSNIIELYPNYFKQCKVGIKESQLMPLQSKFQKVQTIKIDNMKDLDKIKEFQIVEIQL
ncbi:hypothetical protein ABPG73_008252, partial [Tetrahymena malaccensis]